MKHLSMLLGLLLATAGNSLMAQEVSVGEAESRALDFLTNNTPAAKRAKGNNMPLSLSLAYTSRSENKTCFYVFNVGDDEGFVIAGGDEVAREILGYCDHGSFNYETAPENFKWWLGEYTNQIAHAEFSTEAGSLSSYSAPRRAKAAKQRESIGPLIKTKWNQDYPYNSQIPVYSSDGQRYATGCVATATAQVMNYWKHPTQGTGFHDWIWEDNQFSANFGETIYDWDNMLPSYDGGFTETQSRAVGTLMYHVGVSVDMQYGTSGSGAYGEDIGNALVSYFKYDPSLRYELRFYYSDEDWEDLVYNELVAGRPLIYQGDFVIIGHEFICDGYDSDLRMFTINWGWGGYYDGSYPLSGVGALYPEGANLGGIIWGGGYTYNQRILSLVQPECGGSEKIHLGQVHHVDNAMYLKINDETYDDHYDYDLTSGDLYCYLYTTFWNHCWSNTTSFDLGVKLTEVATGTTYYWSSVNNVTLDKNKYYNPYPLRFNPHDLTFNGLYEVRPVCRKAGHPDEEWIDIDIWKTEPIITLNVTGASDPLPSEISFSIEGNTVQACRTLQIKHSPYYTGAITYTSSNENIATVDENGLVTGVSPGDVTITVTGEAQGNFNQTTTSFDIKVTKLVKDDVSFSINGDLIYVDEKLKIRMTPVNYDGELVFTSSDESIATVDENGVIIGQGRGTVEITATVPESTLWNPTTATFEVTVDKYDIQVWANTYLLKVGETAQFSWTEGYEGVPVFKSENEALAVVDETGKVTALAEGEALILVSAPETRLYNACNTKRFTITIKNGDEVIFVEPPYFNNDNNPYEDDFDLHYKAINVSDHRTSGSISITEIEGGVGRLLTGTKLLNPNEEASSKISLTPMIRYYTVGLPSTVFIYYDYNCTRPWNFPSVSFTYRDKLTVDYNVGETGYGTLILPFNQELPEGMKVYGCTGVDDNGVLTLVEDNSIRRNVPYIVKATPGSAYQFVGPEAIDEDKPSFTNGILVGTVAETVPLIAGSDYIMQEQNGRVAFFKFTGTPSSDPSENDNEGNRLAKPFRAFLRLNDSTLAMLYLPDQIGDEGEGIEEIGNDNARPAGIYSIDGKRHNSLQKGLNVIVQDDGSTRKVYVK